MLKKYLVHFGLSLLLLAASQANAAVAVDTGTPTGSGSPLALDNTDWVAGFVHFDQATQIDSVLGYLDDNGNGGGNFSIALYTDNANKVGSFISSADAAYSNLGWNGASNLNWSVDAGDYWVALEVNDFSNFLLPVGAPNPLTHTAFNEDSGYKTFDGLSFGLQVNTVAAVPEPETYALMLGGLVMLGWVARRRNV